MDFDTYPLSILLLGGDLRQARLAELLARRGHRVAVAGMEGFTESDALEERMKKAELVVLPLPVLAGEHINAPLSKEKIPLSRLLDALRPGVAVLGGMIPETLAEEFRRRGVKAYDYFAREELAVLNAIATAEGAIAIAMEETPFTLWGSDCLVTGFGRVGSALARRLKALGAEVTVAARSHAALAKAREAGCRAICLGRMEEELRDARIIFNTVPALIFGRGELALVSRDALLIDLASKPGGLDFQQAAELGLRAIWALSLPGKVAPRTSGEIIFDAVKNIMEETGVRI